MKLSGIYLLLFTLIFLSCNSGPKPEEVATIFLDSMNQQDFETAKKHATERTLKLIDFLSNIAEMAKQEGAAFADADPVTNVKCTIADNKATCTFCCVEDQGESDIELLKVDGQWKVDIAFDGFDEGGFESLLDTTYYPNEDEESLTEELNIN